MIVTIDGPAGAGKGTVAQFLAEKYNLKKLDTGMLYRALAKQVIQNNITDIEQHYAQIIDLARKITICAVDQEGLRNEEVANQASILASNPEIRKILNKLQRDFAYATHPSYQGVVLDGRDIGTVICPQADCKIFLTASFEARSRRRNNQIGELIPHKQLVINKIIQERDQRDEGRQNAPLSAAENAYIIDTTNLTITEVCSTAADYVDQFLVQNKNNLDCI